MGGGSSWSGSNQYRASNSWSNSGGSGYDNGGSSRQASGSGYGGGGRSKPGNARSVMEPTSKAKEAMHMHTRG
jgi:hypothetical protein